MTAMHADEITVADETVRRLLVDQLPDWAALPLVRLPPGGTDNQLFRLGDDLLVRMPRVPGPAETVAFEHAWLPRLAEHLPLPIPAPLALGEPGHGYPWSWTVVPWIEGATPTSETFDPEEWAVSLASFVRSCRAVPAMGGPVKTAGRGAPLAALDEGNLLVLDGRLAAVIDWGAAGRGDPAIELNAMWGYLPESVAELYRAEVGLDEAAYRRARGFALAPSISALTYYRDTAPWIAEGSLETLHRLITSLDG